MLKEPRVVVCGDDRDAPPGQHKYRGRGSELPPDFGVFTMASGSGGQSTGTRRSGTGGSSNPSQGSGEAIPDTWDPKPSAATSAQLEEWRRQYLVSLTRELIFLRKENARLEQIVGILRRSIARPNSSREGGSKTNRGG